MCYIQQFPALAHCCCLVTQSDLTLRPHGLMDSIRQDPLSMVFSEQEYCSGLPFPPPGDVPNPGIEPASSAWQVDSLSLSHLGSPTQAQSKHSRNVPQVGAEFSW